MNIINNNSKIGILAYGSLYYKLCYNNNSIKDILIYSNNKPIFLPGPKLPIILGRKDKFNNITRTLECNMPLIDTIIYLIKSNIDLSEAFKKLALREGGYYKYIHYYNLENKKIVNNINNNKLSELLLSELEKYCIKYNLDNILFVHFPYNMIYNIKISDNIYINEYYYNIYLREFIKNNKHIINKLYMYLKMCDPITVNYNILK